MDIYEKTTPDLKIRRVSDFPLQDYYRIHQQLIQSDHETRSKMEGMDKMRVEMIVIASVFTNFILRTLHFKRLLHTHNSLKEGVMDQLISENL
jgi:exopolyphosphatase/guanosine-5'-triphosphate,3'-diphosphate pyrophosphatase